jgi:hypothetical protein
VVQVPGLQRVREVDGVLGALDVELPVALVVGRHVVDGGEVEEVLDVALQALDVVVGDPEPGLGEVADDRLDPVPAAPALDQLVEAPA